MNRLKISLLVFLLFAGTELYAQACCTGGAPLSSSLGIQSYDVRQLVLDLSFDYNKMDRLYSGSDKLGESNRERFTQSAVLRISYPISNKWMITTVIPYVWQKQKVFSSSGNIQQSANALGDIVLLGQYTLWDNRKNQILLAAGPKLPSGTVYKRDAEFGILLPPDLQPGTGSWDGIAAISYSRFGILRATLSLNSLFTYRHSFEISRYDGGQQYRFGNEMVVNLGFTDSFLLGKKIINPGLSLKYRHTQADENNGNNFPNTGGSWIYLTPNIDLEITPNLYLHSNVEIPVYNNVTGTQLVTGFRSNIGLQIRMNTKKN